MREKKNSWKQGVWLLASVSTMALLAGCAIPNSLNPFAESRPKQMMPGARHTPILNPGTTASPSASAMVMTTAPSPSPKMATASVAPVPMAQVAPVVLPSQQSLVRKPIPGNHLAVEMAAEPMSAMPLHDKTVTAPAPASTQPSFFERLFGASPNAKGEEPGNGSDVNEDKKTNSDETAAEPIVVASAETQVEPKITDLPKAKPIEALETPALSSVPPKPVQLENAKTDSFNHKQELESDREKSQHDNAALLNEPSQQLNAKPVDETPVAITPAPAAKPDNAAPHSDLAPVSEPIADDSQNNHSPRRGVDIMTQDQWNAMKTQQADQAENATPLATNEEHKPSFWERLFGSDHTRPPASQIASNDNSVADTAKDNAPVENIQADNADKPDAPQVTQAPMVSEVTAKPAEISVHNELKSTTQPTPQLLGETSLSEPAHVAATEGKVEPAANSEMIGELHDETLVKPVNEQAADSVSAPIATPADVKSPALAAESGSNNASFFSRLFHPNAGVASAPELIPDAAASESPVVTMSGASPVDAAPTDVDNALNPVVPPDVKLSETTSKTPDAVVPAPGGTEKPRASFFSRLFAKPAPNDTQTATGMVTDSSDVPAAATGTAPVATDQTALPLPSPGMLQGTKSVPHYSGSTNSEQ